MHFHKTYLIFLFSIFTLFSFGQPSPITLHELKCENLVRPNAIDSRLPHFSWQIAYKKEQMHQVYYEIQVATDSLSLKKNKTPDLWHSGKIKSAESVMVPYQGKKLASRTLCYWRVRITNEHGETSAWSDIQRFGIGILADDLVKGDFIGLPKVQSPLLRKTFTLAQVSTTFLHVNSLGYYEIYINGKKVGHDVLSPAVSHLDKRSLITTYDVSSYLRKGTNELVLWLGTGWFKKTTGFDVQFDGAVIKAQLDQLKDRQWHTVLTTNSTWQGSASGYSDTGTWQALQFGGERIDANLNPADLSKSTLDKRNWKNVTLVNIPKHTASPQMSEANKIQETFTAKEIKQLADSTWLVDMGKALNGWFEIKLQGLSKNQQLIIEYSDYLDKDGNFLDQGQKDIYIANGNASETFSNKFNHHAFQYVKLSKLKEIPAKEQIKAHLIHTDFRATSSFESSDADLNAIHNMIQYTMRTLSFSGYMVDCPHLERAGYGGDGNSSTNALQTMYAASPLYANWVQAWADVMREGGSLPHVAPNPGAGGGGPYWCSFLIMSSWRTYVNYNDPRLIQRYYPMMKEWLSYVEKYTVNGLLKRWPDTKYRDWYLGDWLAPHGVDAGNQSSVDLVNNCAISECLGMMEKMARLMNNENEAKEFANRRNSLNKLIHQTFFDYNDNSYSTGSQLDMTYPMLVGVTPQDQYEKVKHNLYKITNQRHNNHIAVGLVGVPILTQWAIENKAVDYIYTMLKKRDYPGYLHMIDNGASTTWEYWSGERSRIHNCYNGIGTWFYQAVGGIRVDENNPGYKHILIAPQLPKGLTWANTSLTTAYGEVKVNWNLSSDKLTMDVTVPIGSTATLDAPSGMKVQSVNGKSVDHSQAVTLDNGVYQVEMIL